MYVGGFSAMYVGGLFADIFLGPVHIYLSRCHPPPLQKWNGPSLRIVSQAHNSLLDYSRFSAEVQGLIPISFSVARSCTFFTPYRHLLMVPLSAQCVRLSFARSVHVQFRICLPYH